MISQAPCRFCEDRKIGCHSRCERYLEFSKYRQQINEQRFKQNEFERICGEKKYNEIDKWKKRYKEKVK